MDAQRELLLAMESNPDRARHPDHNEDSQMASSSSSSPSPSSSSPSSFPTQFTPPHPLRQSLHELSVSHWSEAMRPLEDQAGPSNWAQSPTLKRRRSESHSSSSPSSPESKGGTQKRPFLRARTQTPTNFRLANEEQRAQLLVASAHDSPNRHARILLRHDSASNTVYAHYDDEASSSSVESDRVRMSAAAAAVAALGMGMDEDLDANGTGRRGQQALSAAFLQPAPSEHWTRHSTAGPGSLPEQLGEPAACGHVPRGDAMDEVSGTSSVSSEW
ncbi:hypothetical protein IE81DRAFT_321814 [Ceraceosorus guamensis]|uniref:Uncharacterized protein n=1 Tax=Ceraceosorus guamensis TaxID=1522189 RepID=A0A316W323_9BASI|nr:hypothetical protein IE81DRAFT_321814 [Ceraceosorus guamensis]PWN43904.1 hypothetical protein IE81DRAFT_321814 [Ceraceosorus guamensis]